MTPKEPVILPNFICIGAQKTGTTTLYHILKNHPEITVSHPRKETKYFYRDEEYKLGLGFYSGFFSYDTPRKAIGEFDPDYLFFDYIPERIYKDLGTEMKFIVMLRNPIDRAYSQYLMSVKKGFEKLSFEEAIANEQNRKLSGSKKDWNHFSYISRGYYDQQLERYFKFYDKKNFLIINYENEFKENLPEVVKKICGFIGVSDVDLKTNIIANEATEAKYLSLTKFVKKGPVNNLLSLIVPNKEWRKQLRRAILRWNQKRVEIVPLSNEFRIYLYQNYFSDSINNLEKILNTDLTIWKEAKTIVPEKSASA